MQRSNLADRNDWYQTAIPEAETLYADYLNETSQDE
jgi:hypothetical protein